MKQEKCAAGKRIGKGVLRGVNSLVNLAALTLFLLIFAYGCYGMWDANQIYRAASATEYEAYKPSGEDALSFEELQAINPDVFGWITVYGTGIDYPLLQGENNNKYLNTDASGNYSLGGSIFLDSQTKKDFSDFNSMIYGHHMENHGMFGDVELFMEKRYFDAHKYGNLFYEDKDHGIEFFAMLKANAYDETVYAKPLTEEAGRQDYLNVLLQKAICSREISVQTSDHVICLSTCTSEPSEGRFVLVGKISEETYPDPYAEKGSKEKNRGSGAARAVTAFFSQVPVWMIPGAVVLLTAAVLGCYERKKRKKQGKKKEGSFDEEKP